MFRFVVLFGLAFEFCSAYGLGCETEYRSGAEVCVAVDDVSLDCDKSYDGSSYRSCRVDVDYALETDYKGSSSLSVETGCEAVLSVKKEINHYAMDESEYETDETTLFAHGYEREGMSIDFLFLYGSDVTFVKVGSVECRVSNIDLW